MTPVGSFGWIFSFEFGGLFGELRPLSLSSRNGGDYRAGRANSVKPRARDSGDLRSALTEFAPALRCHYPGQAGF